MAIIPQSGSLPPVSVSNPVNDIDQNNINDKAIADERHIADTLLTKESVNMVRYPSYVDSLLGYPTGAKLKVDLYRQIHSRHGNKATVTDLSATLSSNHVSYDLIRDLVLHLPQEIEYSYDSKAGNSESSGEAIVVPGINPHNGDIIAFPILGNQIGVFQITSVERASISNGSYLLIKFKMTEYGTSGLLQKCKEQTRETYFFNQDTFLSSDGSALLTSKSYNLANEIARMRQKLLDFYSKKFYSDYYSTLMRPDGIYDPYILDFFNRTTSITEIPRPTQHMPDHLEFDGSIWGRLLEPYNRSIEYVFKDYFIFELSQSFWGSRMVPLINKKFICMRNGDAPLASEFNYRKVGVEENYAFSIHFYEGDVLKMTDIEKILYQTIDTQICPNIDLLMNYCRTVINKPVDELFYTIPACLYLLKYAYNQITLQ